MIASLVCIGENRRLQTLLLQKGAEIDDTRKVSNDPRRLRTHTLIDHGQITSTLQGERERLAEIIRQEFADRLVTTEDENRRVKLEIAELRARQQLELNNKNQEIDELRQRQDNELATIHEK
jgi:5-azacytidine-induced protein 1